MPDHSSQQAGVSDGRAARWSGQRERRRAEFVEAAIAAIAEHGPGVSTARIAEHAGVARPRLYRHFTDADELYQAVAQRAAELLIGEMAPLLDDRGDPPARIIEGAVRTHVQWIADHANLYRYITRHAVQRKDGDHDVVADIKTTIGTQVSALLQGYLEVLDLNTRIADPVAFGTVGFVETATDRWLSEGGTLGREELIGYLSSWIWAVLDHALRAEGVVLDPEQPLPAPTT